MRTTWVLRALAAGCLAALAAAAGSGCGDDEPAGPETPPPAPQCSKPPHARTDAHTPRSMVPDWGDPVRLEAPINSPCPQDAIEISRDGLSLFILYTTDVLENLTPAEIVSPPNGTYVARRANATAEFATPALFDLGAGIDASLDGAPTFAPDGRHVYFHSLRATNTGYRLDPPTEDLLDIYVAEIEGGRPGPAVNLGLPVNSGSVDGEPALHPDGVTLYFASNRAGSQDLWHSRRSGSAWTAPVRLDEPVNSPAEDLQPSFSPDGSTLYFVSDRDPLVGTAIYRSFWDADAGRWGSPEPVIQGIAGEPSITGDGRTLFFVHVLSDAAGIFDADVWYCVRAGDRARRTP